MPRLYGKYARSHQGWAPVEELIGTQTINPKAHVQSQPSARPFRHICSLLPNNCFILSLNIYQSTYFGFNPDDINFSQQRSAKLILGRPWLAAPYLPHIFRWLGIAPALDPAVTLTAACLGYWLTGEAHFCAPSFCYVLRTKKGPLLCHIKSYCFAPISIALRPSRPAWKLASKPAPRCFVLISMVSRCWSLRLALRPASNFVSSYKF